MKWKLNIAALIGFQTFHACFRLSGGIYISKSLKIPLLGCIEHRLHGFGCACIHSGERERERESAIDLIERSNSCLVWETFSTWFEELLLNHQCTLPPLDAAAIECLAWVRTVDMNSSGLQMLQKSIGQMDITERAEFVSVPQHGLPQSLSASISQKWIQSLSQHRLSAWRPLNSCVYSVYSRRHGPCMICP